MRGYILWFFQGLTCDAHRVQTINRLSTFDSYSHRYPSNHINLYSKYADNDLLQRTLLQSSPAAFTTPIVVTLAGSQQQRNAKDGTEKRRSYNDGIG